MLMRQATQRRLLSVMGCSQGTQPAAKSLRVHTPWVQSTHPAGALLCYSRCWRGLDASSLVMGQHQPAGLGLLAAPPGGTLYPAP